MRLPEILFLAQRALSSPLEAAFTLLIFILSKENSATFLQLTILACVKPVVSLFAFHLNASILGRPQKIQKFLILMILLGALPSLFFPIVNSNWLLITFYAFFMISIRASGPPWIELLKSNYPFSYLSTIVARGSSINYFLIIVIPLVLGKLIDGRLIAWQSLFFWLNILYLLSLLILYRLKETCEQSLNQHYDTSRKQLKLLKMPWKKGWDLLKNNISFSRYQALFFLGGAGLVLIHPILPVYFKETLNLTYTELAIAFSICRGVAFIITSQFWVRLSKRRSLFFINGIMNILSFIFIGLILASSGQKYWLFLAYIFYGAMQAGCELSWNLSGPFFSRQKESTPYSNTNLVLVGLRGCICPFAGQLLFSFVDSTGVIIFSGLLCFLSIFYGFYAEKIYQQNKQNQGCYAH